MGIELVDRYFWLLAMGVSLVNVAVLQFRFGRRQDERPEDATARATLVRQYLFWMNLPWLVMGAGILSGGASSTWAYFQPRSGNPWVLGWFATVFALWTAASYWLFLRGGAETVANNPDLLGWRDSKSPWMIKLYWLICLAGGIAGVVMMWTQDIPLPPVR